MTFEEADSAYPFERGLLPEAFSDLEKLRAIEHPVMRRLAWEAVTERDRKARGRGWGPAKPEAQAMKPASREFVDLKRRASGDDQ